MGDGDDGAIRVLLAEDEAVLRSALIDLINDEPGLTVCGDAQDAWEAIALAAAVAPEVAVLDVRMPGGGGPTAARGILAASPRTVIVAYTAHGDPDTVAHMRAAGARFYLVKGCDASEIIETLRTAGRYARYAPD